MITKHILYKVIPNNKLLTHAFPEFLKAFGLLRLNFSTSFLLKIPYAWSVPFLIHHISYFYYFHKGLVKQAYHHRVNSLFLLTRKGKQSSVLKTDAQNYLKILSSAGCLDSFLGPEQFKWVQQNLRLQENFIQISNPLFKRNEVACLLGPLASLEQANVDTETVCIKPERYKEELTRPVLSYYNNHDFKVLKDQIMSLYHEGKILKVLTRNQDFFHLDWVVPAFPPPIKVSFISPLAINIIVNSLYCYGYSKVKLRGFNFYLGDKIYDKSYYSSLKESEERVDNYKFFDSLAKHDILINYIYLKRFSDIGVIETDSMFDYLKHTNPVDYIEQFEKRYQI